MDGTREQPWVLQTPSGASEFTAFRDDSLDPPALVVQVGKTELRYHLRCLDDLEAMLRERGDWVPLGSADEQKPAAEGTVEAWARADDNPVGGFYGLKKGLRGRFGNYVPPVMEALGRAEVEPERTSISSQSPRAASTLPLKRRTQQRSKQPDARRLAARAVATLRVRASVAQLVEHFTRKQAAGVHRGPHLTLQGRVWSWLASFGQVVSDALQWTQRPRRLYAFYTRPTRQQELAHAAAR